ncbi:hypothetical protein Tco_0762060 [Tanacetum coccineum]
MVDSQSTALIHLATSAPTPAQVKQSFKQRGWAVHFIDLTSLYLRLKRGAGRAVKAHLVDSERAASTYSYQNEKQQAELELKKRASIRERKAVAHLFSMAGGLFRIKSVLGRPGKTDWIERRCLYLFFIDRIPIICSLSGKGDKGEGPNMFYPQPPSVISNLNLLFLFTSTMRLSSSRLEATNTLIQTKTEIGIRGARGLTEKDE